VAHEVTEFVGKRKATTPCILYRGVQKRSPISGSLCSNERTFKSIEPIAINNQHVGKVAGQNCAIDEYI